MPIPCPMCNKNLPRGKTYDFTDLARIVVKLHICKNCGAEIYTDHDTEEIIKVNGKFVDTWQKWKKIT